MAFKRGKIWYLDYADHVGKRHREPWSTSQEAAETEEKKRKRLVLLLKNHAGQFGQIRWEDFKVLVHSSLYPKLKPSTVNAYKKFIQLVDQHIAPHKLIDVTPPAVENMRVKLALSGMGKHHLERVIRAGFALFTWAWEMNLIEKVEWKAVKNTHLKRSAPVFLTLEEFKKVTHAWDPYNQNPKDPIKHCKQLYTFALLCRRMMMRPSEAWFARWPLTDLENAEYHLLDETKAGFEVKVQSYRTIPIPTHLLEYLKELKKTAKSEYIIEWDEAPKNHHLKNGRPMKAARFFCHVSWALTALGFKKATAYSFRHTGATHMVVKVKESLSTTGRIMGHKEEKTTSVYVHPVTDDMREAVEKLEQMEYPDEHKKSRQCIANCDSCLHKNLLLLSLICAEKILFQGKK